MEQSKRTMNAERRRGDILENALKVFAKEGFHRTDVQVLADLSNVGKGTIYRHFGNKEELFLATGKFCVDQLGAYIRGKVGDEQRATQIVEEEGTAQLLRRIAIACAEYYQEHPQAVEMMIQERAEFRESVFPTHLMYRAETRSGLDELIAAAVAAGEFRKLNAQSVTDALADLLFGSVVNGCLEGSRTKLVERVTRAMDVFLHGLVNSRSDERHSDRVQNSSAEV